MSTLKEFFVYQSLIFKPQPEHIRIYTYSQEDIYDIQRLQIKSIEDCESFYSQLTQLLEQYREEECILVNNNEIEDISSYSFTPPNRLTGQKKERFEYLQSMKQLLEALHQHYKSLPQLDYSLFSSQISTIYKLISDEISSLQEQVKELQQKEQSRSSELQLKQDSQKELFKQLEEYKTNFLNNKRSYEKKQKELQTVEKKIMNIRNKEELYNRYISQLKVKLTHIHSSKKASYLPSYQLILSLGLMYYSSKNTKQYQIERIEEKIFTYENTIQKLQTKLVQHQQHLDSIQEEADKYAQLCSDDEIERREQELEEMNEKIVQIKTKHKDCVAKQEEFQLKVESLKQIQQQCSKDSIQQLLKTVNSQIELIEHQLELYSQNPINSMHDGHYYQNA